MTAPGGSVGRQESPTIESTSYTVSGVATGDDARVVKDEVSGVRGIGAVAIELLPGGSAVLIIKHKGDVEPDRQAIAAAVRAAGDHTLV